MCGFKEYNSSDKYSSRPSLERRMENLKQTLRENLAEVYGSIEKVCASCGRDPAEVSVMAVTKTHPVEYMQAAIECGIRHIGENRISEGGRKIRKVGRESAVFHAIGVLHRSEVRQAVRDFHCLDAVDSLKILEEIARRGASPEILLEVNTSGERAKKGFQPDIGLLCDVLGRGFSLGLSVKGLLTIGPLGEGESSTRKAFEMLRTLRDSLSESLGKELPVLSMGMSDDFDLAVAEGSTIVRLGGRLFGPRG